MSEQTLLFEEDPTFGHDYGNISVNVALAVLINERYGNIGVRDTLAEWDTEDAGRADF